MSRVRSGFTLVELLVVAALLAMLFGLILTAGRGGSGKSGARRAAQELASMLLAAQSRALGKPEGAAVIVVADAANSRQGTAAHEGIGLPPIIRQLNGNGRLPADAQVLSSYKARLRKSPGADASSAVSIVSPWFGVRGGELQRRQSAGQNERNTLLDPPGPNLEAVVVRFPVMGPKPVTFGGQIAIDLRHSGVGDDPAATHGHGRFENGSPVAVVFEQSGRVGEVILGSGNQGGATTDPIQPSETIYFLLTEKDAIDGNQSLRSAKSYWVAVNPQTGRINVSANEPTETDDLILARLKARRDVAVGK